MTYAILPLTEDTWQVFTLDLSIDGEAFHAQIEIRYLEAPDQWYLSIWDHALGEMLVNQIPLICSYEQLNDLLDTLCLLRPRDYDPDGTLPGGIPEPFPPRDEDEEEEGLEP